MSVQTCETPLKIPKLPQDISESHSDFTFKNHKNGGQDTETIWLVVWNMNIFYFSIYWE